jgi:hypothetical protein
MSNDQRVDHPADVPDGSPQPASQPMSRETALYYTELTKGQLTAFLHADGNWYLYAPKPVDVIVQPKKATAKRTESPRW